MNSLNELFLSPALKDLLDFSFTRQNTGPRPVLNTKSKVFELDSCRTIGKVIMDYSRYKYIFSLLRACSIAALLTVGLNII